MEWVTKWYDLYAEWDKLNTKRYQLMDVRDGKLDLLKQWLRQLKMHINGRLLEV